MKLSTAKKLSEKMSWCQNCGKYMQKDKETVKDIILDGEISGQEYNAVYLCGKCIINIDIWIVVDEREEDEQQNQSNPS